MEAEVSMFMRMYGHKGGGGRGHGQPPWPDEQTLETLLGDVCWVHSQGAVKRQTKAQKRESAVRGKALPSTHHLFCGCIV